MPGVLDVLTLAEAKDAINVNSTQNRDTLLALYITSISARMDVLLGPIVTRTITAELHNGGRDSIFLNSYPVTSVASVTEYDRGQSLTTVLTPEILGDYTPHVDTYEIEPFSTNPALFGNRIKRQQNGHHHRFAHGRRNVSVSYTAGRFADTESVDEKYKLGAGYILLSAWRSQQDSTAKMGDFDVPFSSVPKYMIPYNVIDMFYGEVQQRGIMVG